MKRGKKYLEVAKLVDQNKLYTIEEAAKLVKQTNFTKFDATVDATFKLNVDIKVAGQQVRGTLVLPHGNGKSKKVLAITDRVEEAKTAGADFAGGKEMIDKIIQENWLEFDVIVATPNMMGEIGKAAKILGPRGLMPNPKSGTVSPDITKAINEIKSGKVEYRVDKQGNLHVSIGKVSFDAQKIAENLAVLCETVVKARPAAVKGTYIKSAVLHSTMGPGIKLTFEGR